MGSFQGSIGSFGPSFRAGSVIAQLVSSGFSNYLCLWVRGFYYHHWLAFSGGFRGSMGSFEPSFWARLVIARLVSSGSSNYLLLWVQGFFYSGGVRGCIGSFEPSFRARSVIARLASSGSNNYLFVGPGVLLLSSLVSFLGWLTGLHGFFRAVLSGEVGYCAACI